MKQATNSRLRRRVFRSRPTLGLTCCFLGVWLALGTPAHGSADGRVRRARLGVSTKDISSEMQKLIRNQFNLESEAGVIVAQVAPGSSAAQAGLRKGDLIIRVGSTLITGGRQLATQIARLQPGQTVTIAFAREVTLHTTRVTLGAVGGDEGPSESDPGTERVMDPVAALFAAAARGDTDKVTALIRSGVDVRARNGRGQVPLHVACAAGQTQAAKLLIEADRARGDAELRGTVIANFDEYIEKITPTLGARDQRGDTPLHAAARNGRTAAAKLLIDSGADKNARNRDGQTAGQIAAQTGSADMSDALGDQLYSYEPPVVEPPSRVTRYAPKLEEVIARLREIQRRLAQAQAARAPQADVLVLGRELLQVGTDLEVLLDGPTAKATRFGTIEEADLIATLKEAHGQATQMLGALALVKLESAAEGDGRSGNEMRQLLRDAGRMVIEEEAMEWMRKNGLEDLLVENGYNRLRGKVTQGIELNLRTFLDKKSTELIGMPLGGFRSMQAAFRLQARRAVRETVAELILNFSGNQLAVYLLQRHIVHWVEDDLWPQLREAFRPKTRLDRRVRISMETMEQASEALNRLAQGRDPTYLPIAEVHEALDRAEGKIRATRYLKRDLERAQNQALMDELVAAERLLQGDIERIQHQFLLRDAERWKDMADNLQYVAGMHVSVRHIVETIPEEQRRIEAAVRRFFQAALREDTAAIMALFHEQSPARSPEAAARLRQYFATHITQSDGLTITKIVKESDQDADVTMVERAHGSTQTLSLVFRRSGATWKLYGVGDGR